MLLANFSFGPGRGYFSNSSAGHLGWGLGAAIGANLVFAKGLAWSLVASGACVLLLTIAYAAHPSSTTMIKGYNQVTR